MAEARRRALEVLYEAEQLDQLPEQGELPARVDKLVRGVWDSRRELDGLIDSAASGWSPHRMPVVDLTIVRIGLFELLHHEHTPTAVILNEAVELAKEYSTAKSGGFVNGVLATLAKEARPAA